MLKRCGVENNHVIPDEVIIDQSAAFLLAILETYTKFKSVHQYLDHCYEILREGKETADEYEKLYVRLDRSHVTKTIQQNNGLAKGVNKNTAIFYRRILGYLIQEPSVDICADIIQKMFVVLNNRYITESVHKIIKELEKLANEHKVEKINIERRNELPDFDIELDEKPKNKFLAWVLEMAQVSKSDINNESFEDSPNINPYFADSLEKPLVTFLSQLPLCGNIMNSAKGSNNETPTSSPTENDFDVLKNDLFRGSHGIRVDSFVSKHLLFTKGRLIGKRVNAVRAELFDDQSQDEKFENSELLAKSESCDEFQEKSSKSSEKSLVCASLDEQSHENEQLKFENMEIVSEKLSEGSNDEVDTDADNNAQIDEFDSKHNKFENFGGQNEDWPRRPKKINRCQSSILNPMQGVNRSVSILKNGHTSTTGRPVVVTKRTCAFDSVFNFYVVAYADVPGFKEMIDNQKSEICNLIKMMFNAKDNKIYNFRNNLLQNFYQDDMFKTKISDRQLEIDCNSTIDYIFGSFCEQDDIFYSIRINKVCNKCEFIRYVQCSVNMNGFDIMNIQKSIGDVTDYRKNEKCDDCGSVLATLIQPSTMVLLETDLKFANELTSKPSKISKISDISPEITFYGWKFNLKRVICLWEKGGHFYTFVKRKNERWEKFDDLSPRDRSISQEAIYVAALFYEFEDKSSAGIYTNGSCFLAFLIVIYYLLPFLIFR